MFCRILNINEGKVRNELSDIVTHIWYKMIDRDEQNRAVYQ